MHIRYTMANTDGLSDEVVSSMLAMPSQEEEKQYRISGSKSKQSHTFPRRALSRREQMMEQLGEGEAPSATVIRSSKAPKVQSSSKRKSGKAVTANNNTADTQEGKNNEPMESLSSDYDSHANKPNHKPVMLSSCIRERPVVKSTAVNDSNNTSTTKRESRFKQRNRIKNGSNIPTVGGFPSLDAAPVGTFTRRGRSSAHVQQSPPLGNNFMNVSNIHQANTQTNTQTLNGANSGVGKASDSMLANMSLDDIQDGVDEIKSILSAESIAFLRSRGKQKKLAKSKESINIINSSSAQPLDNDTTIKLSKHEAIQLEEKRAHEEKEKMAQLLSSVRSPEDMDRVYKEALQIGLATELPSSSVVDTGGIDADDNMNDRLKNLHIATSLLRSTSPRQRLLGVRSVCQILEEDVNEMVNKRRAHAYSETCDEREIIQKEYPQLLPVAIRCLLDESIATYQTSGGRQLLSIVLRCIHALVTLCVHPYHVVNVCPVGDGCDDPFILYQTCFMSDISHVPPGTSLYPPTQIKPLDHGGGENNAACYKADSSAATAESDSKAFYTDPTWTLLSRMRILPCLSDVITCLSVDDSTEMAISNTTIQSICGILALLAVRSPGAAGAITRHKGILPFLVSFSLSPSNDNNVELFNAGVALPTLIMLCHLARQSRDIAELEVPFQTIIPDLQAILCTEGGNDDEIRIQMWSIILLRILMRYNLAIEHVQSFISILAPRVQVMDPEHRLGAHCLMLFASICDASKVMSMNANNGQNLEAISEDANDSLAMSGVWLSSSVRGCITSLQSAEKGSGNDYMKLLSSQLQLISSYISTAAPTMNTESIPIVSEESCLEVISSVLTSNMLDDALSKALGASFSANWNKSLNTSQDSEVEAVSCAFVSSVMTLVQVVGVNNLSSDVKSKLFKKILASLEKSSRRNYSLTQSVECNIHTARQSWLIESEFSVLKVLCEDSNFIQEDDTSWHLIATFAFSLIGRLNIGHEAMAAFIFSQDVLFKVRNKIDPGQSLRKLFLAELNLSSDRRLQLNHSSSMYFMQNINTYSLSSLRCVADFVGGSSNTDGDRFFLPLGGLWMWNVLSSSTTTNALPDAQREEQFLDIVSRTLCLLLHLEMVEQEECYTKSISDGTKLYHITNVCLCPEMILSDEGIESSLRSLFQLRIGFGHKTTDTSSSLISEFVKACFQHSRLSKETKQKHSQDEAAGDTEKKLQEMLIGEKSSSSTEVYSKDEMRALNDFVDDMCNAYIEYGGQYATFTLFMRLFLRHDFPSTVISNVLTKLHPILNVLTIEDEDKDTLHVYLSHSISGGLPNVDSSHRDPSSVLDSFSTLLKKTDKELLRNDFVYLLAVAVLARNLASSSQRCECGLKAMKNRLRGVSDTVFFDIFQVSKKILVNESGTKDNLITCVLDVCLDNESEISKQDSDTQNDFQWNSDNRDAVWRRLVESLAVA